MDHAVHVILMNKPGSAILLPSILSTFLLLVQILFCLQTHFVFRGMELAREMLLQMLRINGESSDASDESVESSEIEVDEEVLRLAAKTARLLDLVSMNQSRFPCNQFGFWLAHSPLKNDSEGVLDRYLHLERYCFASEATSSRNAVNDVDVDIFQAFYYPSMISQRFPLQAELKVQMCERTVKTMWCRMVAYYFEWLTGVPEVRLFSDADKVALTTSHLCKVLCFVVAFNTYATDLPPGMIVFCGGVYFDSTRSDSDSQLVKLFGQALSNILHDAILPQLRRVRLTKEEFVLLKLIIFFNVCQYSGLSEAGYELARSMCNKYRNTLAETIRSHVERERRDLQSAEKQRLVLTRLQTILHISIGLETMGEVDNQYLMQMIACNYGGLKGTLPTQIHIERRKMQIPLVLLTSQLPSSKAA